MKLSVWLLLASCYLVPPLLKRSSSQTVSATSTVEPFIDGNWKQQTQEGLLGHLNHMCTWMIICLLTLFSKFLFHNSSQSELSFFEEIQNITCWIVFRAEQECCHSLVGLATHTKAQFFFTMGLYKHLEEAKTIKETCLSSSFVCFVITSLLWPHRSVLCVFTDCNVPNKALDYY